MEAKSLTELTLIDTDILIDASRQIAEAIDYLEKLEGQSQLAICIITQMELFVGCRNKVELRVTEVFLRRFEIIRLNESISEKACDLLRQYRLSHGLAIPDALIAATALFLDMEFATKNQKDYCFIDGLRLLPYLG